MCIFSSVCEENISAHCKGMWDDLNCWPPAPVGETVSQPCPNHEFFNSEGEKRHMQSQTHLQTDTCFPRHFALWLIICQETNLFS